MTQYNSSARIYPQCVDSRWLYMEVDYFQLTKEQRNALVGSFAQWCTTLWEKDFLISCYVNDRKTPFFNLTEKIQCCEDHIIIFEGAVQTDQISDHRAFNRFLKYMERYENEFCPSDASIDYTDFYRKQKAKYLAGSITLKEFVLSLLREPGKICFSPAPFPELQGCACGRAYEHDSTRFHGSISIALSVYSTGENLEQIAAEMTGFLTEQAQLYQNMNGRVGITPLSFPSEHSAHMCYFDDKVYMDGSHEQAGVAPEEWYPYYYLRGVEWFNLISPLAKRNILSLLQAETGSQCMLLRELESGSVVVRLNTPITGVDVAGLLLVKELLYDGLYPGMRELPIEVFMDEEYMAPIAKIRMQWECIPVLDDEIVVTEKNIIFRHTGTRGRFSCPRQ